MIYLLILAWWIENKLPIHLERNDRFGLKWHLKRVAFLCPFFREPFFVTHHEIPLEKISQLDFLDPGAEFSDLQGEKLSRERICKFD